jgi:4'-phosphopantetheinyl transferase
MAQDQSPLSDPRNAGSTPFRAGKTKVLPTLAPNEIHIWRVGGDARKVNDLSGFDILAPAERTRASQFISEADRAHFIERRAALRMVLAGYLAIAPQDIAFAVNEFGKPSVLASKASDDLAFNTSHSRGFALIAVGRSIQIGIDVERLRPGVELEAIAARFFTANEAGALAALPSHDRVEGFFNAWTRKEAVVKALGRGLSIPLDSFEVSLRPREPPAILRWNIPGAPPQSWRIHHIEPALGYVGAVVVDRDPSTCRYLTWPI